MRGRRCLREGLLAFHYLALSGRRPVLLFGVAKVPVGISHGTGSRFDLIKVGRWDERSKRYRLAAAARQRKRRTSTAPNTRAATASQASNAPQ